MNSSEIFNILSTKPNNPHYLKRYIRFIKSMIELNNSGRNIKYSEEHHICPKAKDLFPEYANLSVHRWNSILLSTREHIIAHVILWKAYGGSQTTALHYMLNVQNEEFNSQSHRKIPACWKIKIISSVKEENRINRLGFGNYKDLNGNMMFIHKDDPLIQELSLVGHVKGRTHDDVSKQKMAEYWFDYLKIRIYFLDLSKVIYLNREDFDEHLAQGWRYHLKMMIENILRNFNMRNHQWHYLIELVI